MTIALKPCPAGHDDVALIFRPLWTDGEIERMPENYGFCRACGWKGPLAETSEKAAEAWNTRAEPKVISETLAYVGRGMVVADSGFSTQSNAWKIMLGWPDGEEIEEAKARGDKVIRVKIIAAEE